MDNIKNDRYYIDKIITDLQFIVNHTKGVDKQNFEENELLQDSVMFRLVQIAENSSKISESFKARHMAVAWMQVRGLRNRIVHDYGKIDLTVIFDTIKNDIPTLLEYLIEKA